MNYDETEEFKRDFKKTGSREEVKEVQKQVEKFWHNVYIPKREEGKKAFLIFLEEIKKI